MTALYKAQNFLHRIEVAKLKAPESSEFTDKLPRCGTVALIATALDCLKRIFRRQKYIPADCSREVACQFRVQAQFRATKLRSASQVFPIGHVRAANSRNSANLAHIAGHSLKLRSPRIQLSYIWLGGASDAFPARVAFAEAIVARSFLNSPLSRNYLIASIIHISSVFLVRSVEDNYWEHRAHKENYFLFLLYF